MNPDPDRLRADLLAFYDRRKRDLPWRRENDPYRILVSEVMLQQTRVDTVIRYYEAWLERFPDVEALAAADEALVLKAWEGLGYYRRARNLHAAARMVRERWEGEMPSTEAALRGLPGVGEYTAGAVASIAFGEAVPAVDGNVRRVLARLFDEPRPTTRWLRDTAAGLVDPERAGDWNQALMELGATVCTPRGPLCETCPVADACAARAAGTVADRPAPTDRRPPRKAIIALAVLRRGRGEVLLERRGREGLLAGMWALPEREIDDVDQAARVALALTSEVLRGARQSGEPASGERVLEARTPLPHVRHRFTHIDATYVPWVIEVGDMVDTVTPMREGSNPERADRSELRWAGEEERSALAVPVAQRAVLRML